MSGGHFSYVNDHACEEIFGWNATPVYNMGGKEYKSGVAFARKSNPLENKMLSELTYDVFCLLHSYDWYASADTSEDTWKKDVEFFVQKWLKISPNAMIEREIHTYADEMRRELLKTFLLFGDNTTAESIEESCCEECKIIYEGDDNDQ